MLRFSLLFWILCFSAHLVKGQKPYSAFNHVSIHVSDLDKSVEFYISLFELDSIPDPFPEYRVTWFKLGESAQFHLFEDKTPIGDKEKYHICFSVRSIDEFIGRLQKRKMYFYDGKGTKDVITKRKDGVQQIYIRDPDGHRVEINDASF